MQTLQTIQTTTTFKMFIALHNISARTLNFTGQNRLPEYGGGRRQFVLCRDGTMNQVSGPEHRTGEQVVTARTTIQPKTGNVSITEH